MSDFLHQGPLRFCEQWRSRLLAASKAGREPFHRFVNAEICHISWWFLRMSLFNVCSKDLWGLFLKKLISKAKKYEIFGKGRTLMSFKGAEHVAKNPNVSENDISLINKGAKNT